MGARVMLTLLISYRGMKEIYVSQSTYGKLLGVSRQTISKYLNELEEAGLIERISQGDGKTCQVKLLPPVTNRIASCKETFTQVTNDRNEKEKLYMNRNRKFNPLTAKDKLGQYNEFDF